MKQARLNRHERQRTMAATPSVAEDLVVGASHAAQVAAG
jgi:hypothetical protein